MNVIEWTLLIIGLIGSALYSGLETGVVSINRLRLQHLLRRQTKGADVLKRFVDDPDLLLGTTLVGTNLCNVAISVTAASIAVRWLGNAGLWMASLTITVLLLIFGEYLPKAWFRGYPAYRVLPFGQFLRASGLFFYPLGMGVMRVARWLIPGPSDADQPSSFITREELAFLTKQGEQSGELSSGERRMMQGVMALTHKTCAEIMVPRSEMCIVRPHTPATQIIELARQKHLSRLPIYDDETRAFKGFVNVMDLLIANHIQGRTAQDVARPPQYVDARAPADQLLARMRLTRQPLALVHDARSEVIGLVSIEDIMEEIVGRL